MNPSCEILLAVHEGEPYLPALLDSLRNQTRLTEILADDDGSTDGSARLLADARGSGLDIRTNRSAPASGASQTFGRLLARTNSPRAMFCDHDDVWLPGKAQQALDAMTRLEAQHGTHAPILIHTDLTVVDADLNEIHASFYAFESLDPEGAKSFQRQLVQNHAVGCTMMMNKALVELARPIPEEALMHDWWVTLVASALGVVHYLPESQILYRQHGKNAVGARSWGPRRITKNLSPRRRRVLVKARQAQAAAFANRYADLAPEAATLSRQFADLHQLPKRKRINFLRENGIRMDHGLQNAGLLLAI